MPDPILSPTGPLRAATLTVADIATAIERYTRWFDYAAVERGVIAADLAAAWAAPAAAGSRYAVLRPASGLAVDLRLVERPALPGFSAMATPGWTALELCVADIHQTHARMQDSPFVVVGPPNAIASLPTIHPMQVEGPDGEFVFLTQILPGGAAEGLPSAHAPIDTLFICVLGCCDLDVCAQWFAQVLGLTIAPPLDIPYRTLSRALGMAPDTRHTICTASRDGRLFLELDQYPAGSVPRVAQPGDLVPGVALVTLLNDRLDSLPGPWLSPPALRDGAIYEGRRSGVLRMPEGALVELVERGG
jgi:catechol 2,3-dioxygenase-like lactoylglutathione lyase family enzyme